ncbi:VanZ family protein [Rhodococcus sp. NPDC058505]|uniref:VanZ family protein n=1 Tax=unclassified Rhodococcus (in: high G+C Gram-positive bacteria) TaxID=192944 RepID=UPI00364E4587
MRIETLIPRRAIPFYAVLAITVVMLFSPGGAVPSGPPNSDKVTHLLMFLALAVAARYAGWRAGWVLLGGVLYAAASEVLQAVLPIQRSGSVFDWLADVVGVLLGLGVVFAWRSSRTGRAR